VITADDKVRFVIKKKAINGSLDFKCLQPRLARFPVLIARITIERTEGFGWLKNRIRINGTREAEREQQSALWSLPLPPSYLFNNVVVLKDLLPVLLFLLGFELLPPLSILFLELASLSLVALLELLLLGLVLLLHEGFSPQLLALLLLQLEVPHASKGHLPQAVVLHQLVPLSIQTGHVEDEILKGNEGEDVSDHLGRQGGEGPQRGRISLIIWRTERGQQVLILATRDGELNGGVGSHAALLNGAPVLQHAASHAQIHVLDHHHLIAASASTAGRVNLLLYSIRFIHFLGPRPGEEEAAQALFEVFHQLVFRYAKGDNESVVRVHVQMHRRHSFSGEEEEEGTTAVLPRSAANMG